MVESLDICIRCEETIHCKECFGTNNASRREKRSQEALHLADAIYKKYEADTNASDDPLFDK